jgi:hypothetical protein
MSQYIKPTTGHNRSCIQDLRVTDPKRTADILDMQTATTAYLPGLLQTLQHVGEEAHGCTAVAAATARDADSVRRQHNLGQKVFFEVCLCPELLLRK